MLKKILFIVLAALVVGALAERSSKVNKILNYVVIVLVVMIIIYMIEKLLC